MVNWAEIDKAISGLEQTMDIHSPAGSKVMVTEQTANNGRSYDSENVKKFLEIGKEYTVRCTIVHLCTTDIYLEEIPGIYFNSVNFVNIKESEEVK